MRLANDWKEHRKMSYLMHEFDDVDLPYEYREMDGKELVDTVIRFFEEGSELLYPAKSYFVAIIYAERLHHYFGIGFYDALDEEGLLPDDKYFVRYSEAKDVYDGILSRLPGGFVRLSAAQKTVEYFKEEYLIGADSESNEPL